ncbi:hypothetical protein [Vibrio rumoiensis]|uniref:hypothetical protein n=1 Tax=Vibrio rumoiensis TaxID=76258 RepID=UPI003AA8435E
MGSKYNKLVSKDKEVFTTPLFWCSILIPLIIAAFIAYKISYSPNFNNFLTHIWQNMKLPIALASLSIPLASWVISNHRSAQIVDNQKKEESKRLTETYLQQEAFFERYYGRKIQTLGWKYIEKEDLPVIHAQVYEFKRLSEKGVITPQYEIEKDLNNYFKGTERSFWDFYEAFVLETKNNNNQYLLDAYTRQLFTFLNQSIHNLSISFGSRNLNLNETILPLYAEAYFEVYNLCESINISPNYTEKELEEHIHVFNAVLDVIPTIYKAGIQDFNLERLSMSETIRDLQKTSFRDTKTSNINSMMLQLNNSLPESIDGLLAIPVATSSDQFIELELITKQDNGSLSIKFIEGDNNAPDGKISLSDGIDTLSIHLYPVDNIYRLGKDDNEFTTFSNDAVIFIKDKLDL